MSDPAGSESPVDREPTGAPPVSDAAGAQAERSTDATPGGRIQATGAAPGPDAAAGPAVAPGGPGGPGTDEAAPPGSASAAPAEQVDLGRRSFFRSFSRDAIQAAAQIVGAATALQRSSLAATGQLLGAATGTAGTPDPLTQLLGLDDPPPPPPAVQYRSPYRYLDGTLTLVDQRRLPDELVEVTCRTGAEVAACIRDRLVRGGPVLGQVAAYGLLVTAERNRSSSEFIRVATLHGTVNALRSARPASRAIEVALDRMVAAWMGVGEYAAGDLVANVLRAEAEAIADEAMLDLAALGRAGAAVLPTPLDRHLEVLVHGPVGALAGGTLGTAVAVLLEVQVQQRSVHAWVPEGRPAFQGARITAFELGRLDIRHTVIADIAAAGLMAHGKVDAVLVAAERIARNGDVSAPVGTYPLAAVAARHNIPLYVCAPIATLDARVGDGWGFMADDRPDAELAEIDGHRIPPEGSSIYNPALDVTPAALVRGFVTEVGVIGPPYEETLADAAGRPRQVATAAPPASPDGPAPGPSAPDASAPDGPVVPRAANAAPPESSSPTPPVPAEDEDGWGPAR